MRAIEATHSLEILFEHVPIEDPAFLRRQTFFERWFVRDVAAANVDGADRVVSKWRSGRARGGENHAQYLAETVFWT